MDALLIARTMSALTRAEFTTASASFSLEGRIADVTLLDLEIAGAGATLRLSPMVECVFTGSVRESGGFLELELVIAFRGADLGELWRCSVESKWRSN